MAITATCIGTLGFSTCRLLTSKRAEPLEQNGHWLRVVSARCFRPRNMLVVTMKSAAPSAAQAIAGSHRDATRQRTGTCGRVCPSGSRISRQVDVQSALAPN
jgi:hypothetical protein